MAFNFSWIVPDMVAGMGRPTASAVDWLRDQGITAVLSLTETAPPGLGDAFDVLHLPIVDMTSPSLDQLMQGVEFMRESVATGGGVVAQCAAGLGRTGTLLAAYLVGDGMSADEAIEHVRIVRPGSIETVEQERAIHKFAELMGTEPD